MIKLKKVADEIEYNGVKGSLKEVLQKQSRWKTSVCRC